MLLWQYYISMGGGTKLVHCDLKGDTIISHSPLSLLFTLRKAVRLFSASALFWASSSNLRTKCNIFSNDRWQVDNSPPPPRILSESKVAGGHQLAKSFLDQFVNLLCCKDFWECAHWDQLLFLLANVASLQFNKVMHSEGLCTHTLIIFLTYFLNHYTSEASLLW